MRTIFEQASGIEQKLVQWRRYFHQFPELSFKEFKTAEFIATTLSSISGVKVEKGIGLETSVIGTLSCGDGPTIALRADIDALPIKEETTADYCSKHDGVMHACGHDAHTAILLGTAQLLAQLAGDGKWNGTIKFIFQPAEETPDQKGLSGSPYLIRAGAYVGVEAALALHMCPWLQVGEMQVHDGYSMANVDEFEAKIIASGGHGGYPEKGTDPTWMLGLLLQSLHGIVARKVSALDEAVISIGEIKAGSATNIIPSEVFLRGTIRSYKPNIRDLLERELEKAFAILEPLGGQYQLKVTRGEPALYNSSFLNQLVTAAAKKMRPTIKVVDEKFGMGGEDFGYVTQKLPGAMFFLGCATADGIQRDLHTPIFDIDERVLVVGTAIMTQATLDYFSGFYEVVDQN
ncbi:peptidase M20 [Alkalihalobacillus alcalophilus ATCC 27647 = CGMCC 1.3604]|uniref:Peptidase M20 n=1 Tax=Alkalihalobacillus alcalophilus ATCC 27647 = CGMCC 1.3604 TaxID=1218173 RepID=A0A094WK95_ALKAL|nr:amidohydrolase [Alkalihalobacillus alcalophilus]KGA98179.1 peptidase M20 [Alkalihalobacillus alcalophilus ATCC 27647 = CGMCC 1.3604]MED1560825.1 amidohydrolase [Alkalihalobacillus alcalophilus]THG91214.1 peptidase M20 [Alkalihalobacillus alcalophilus ATCC 27647 = CGMCC 1.3604]